MGKWIEGEGGEAFEDKGIELRKAEEFKVELHCRLVLEGDLKGSGLEGREDRFPFPFALDFMRGEEGPFPDDMRV